MIFFNRHRLIIINCIVKVVGQPFKIRFPVLHNILPTILYRFSQLRANSSSTCVTIAHIIQIFCPFYSKLVIAAVAEVILEIHIPFLEFSKFNGFISFIYYLSMKLIEDRTKILLDKTVCIDLPISKILSINGLLILGPSDSIHNKVMFFF